MNDMEKKVFVEAILSKNSPSGFHLPEKVYKFVSFKNDVESNKKRLNTFANKQIYLSSPLDFNDPYDCQLNIALIDSMDDFLKLGLNRKERRLAEHNKEAKKYVKNESQNLQEDIYKEWKIFRKQMLICCFTESWDNFLMWSHYANTYNGICIEYDTKSLIDNKKALLPVIYTDKLIAIKDYLSKQEFQQNNFEKFYKAGIYAVISKHLSWSYENEWRLVEIEDSIMKGKPCVLPTPSAVYFGHCLDKKVKEMLIEKSVELKIPDLYDVKISDTEYRLIKQEVKIK